MCAGAQMKWTASYGADLSSSLVSSVDSTMSVRDQYAPSLRRPLARSRDPRSYGCLQAEFAPAARAIYVYILSHCHVMHDASACTLCRVLITEVRIPIERSPRIIISAINSPRPFPPVRNRLGCFTVASR